MPANQELDLDLSAAHFLVSFNHTSGVQALHKLYNIQKSEMQEIKGRDYSQAQVLAFNPESLVLVEGQNCGSVLERKLLRPVCTAGRGLKKDALTLSLRPFCTFKEIKGSGFSWIDGIGDETCPPARREPVRNFDLEKVPEDDADEPADLEGMPKQWKGSVLTESTELFRDLGSGGEVALTSPKSELHNSRRDGYVDSFPKDPVKCSQDSSILEPTELDEFNNIQRTQAMEAVTLNPKDTQVCKKKDTCVSRDNSCKEDQEISRSEEGFLSKCKEVPLISQDVSRSSASSTLTVSEIKHTASTSHSNGDHGNTTSLEKIPVVTVGNQNKKGKSALSEECESLAAEILLSFAPSNKSQADTERHSSESAKSYGDLPTTDEKPDLCQKRCATFSSGGRVYEYLSRTNPANRM
ncbi:hypothetical protein DKX38_027753 [Salix brachista]|uniref:Uncharacterized protein n=1 Tax=Salix brachista TaxID=2182728 RepID=A0A5N5JFQ3_9ROSI|nr:hypothetical protein DKX38_027753 [Salix brachista]